MEILILFIRGSIEFSCGEAHSKVKGGLFRCRSFWDGCLAASPFVSSIVNEGFPLPFVQLPPTFFLGKIVRYCKALNSSGQPSLSF